jgi:hypothetical protein
LAVKRLIFEGARLKAQIFAPILFTSLFGAIFLLLFLRERERIHRRDFIRDYPWPSGLLEKLEARHNWFSRKNSALVAEGLRQFFVAYQMSGCKYVAMPSQVVDDLWHEFILYTRAYEDFCKKAFGGFLHHAPAQALSPENRRSNEGLRRVWWWCCKQESIHPTRPTRLPLLFALDKKLSIANGFHYTTECDDLRKAGVAGAGIAPYCGGDFGDSSFDGSTSGMGDGGGGVDGPGHGHGGEEGHGGDSGGGGASVHGCGGHSSCGGGSCGEGD